ncbi:MAG: hypothetical protein Q8P59_08490 [Dehalococcoidia bacterium]|nr:hypothetical protein [Dehalococcoidia bacterium]
MALDLDSQIEDLKSEYKRLGLEISRIYLRLSEKDRCDALREQKEHVSSQLILLGVDILALSKTYEDEVKVVVMESNREFHERVLRPAMLRERGKEIGPFVPPPPRTPPSEEERKRLKDKFETPQEDVGRVS